MADNLFDTIPDLAPEYLIVGSRWVWTLTDESSTYPTDTYTLIYIFSNLDDESTNEFTLSKVDNVHKFELSSTITAGLPTGNYLVTLDVLRDSDSEVLTLKQFDLVIDAKTSDDTWTYKALKAVKAVIAKTASKEQSQYSVEGRQLIRRSVGELLQLETNLSLRFTNEKMERKRRAGIKTKSRVRERLKA